MKTLFCLLAIIPLLGFSYSNAEISQETLRLQEIPKLTVRGQAQFKKPADELQLNIGLVTSGSDVDSVLRSNNDKMQKVLKALEKEGLVASDYKTGRFSIYPTYSHPPKNPPTDWKPEINGYEVVNKIHVKTTKLDLVSKIIESAVNSGATNIDNISFTLVDSQKYRHEAIAAATKNAIAEAQVLAQSAGLQLVRIIDISVDNFDMDIPRPRFLKASTFALESTTPIEAGDIELSANVQLSYEIK